MSQPKTTDQIETAPNQPEARSRQPDDTPHPPLAVGVPGICRMSGDLSRAYVYRAIANGELVTFKVGRRRMALVKEVEAWISRLAKEGER